MSARRWAAAPVGAWLAISGAAAAPEMARVEVVAALPFAQAGIEAQRLPYTVQVLERDALDRGSNLVEAAAHDGLNP